MKVVTDERQAVGRLGSIGSAMRRSALWFGTQTPTPQDKGCIGV